MVMFIGLQFFKCKEKKLPYFPFPLYYHLWTQHHLFVMLRILCSWIFNLLTKWNGLDITYLLCLESYGHGSFVLLENGKYFFKWRTHKINEHHLFLISSFHTWIYFFYSTYFIWDNLVFYDALENLRVLLSFSIKEVFENWKGSYKWVCFTFSSFLSEHFFFLMRNCYIIH